MLQDTRYLFRYVTDIEICKKKYIISSYRGLTSSIGEYVQSNCRAEIGVKTANRLITDNTDLYAELDINKFQWAILQYRNAPD